MWVRCRLKASPREPGIAPTNISTRGGLTPSANRSRGVAVVTPSGDPLTLLLLSGPLYLLYEADIWLIRFLLRR